MLFLNINQAKNLFFDAPAVLKAVDKAERQVLSKYGAFVRRTARQSLRKRKGPSKPGSPPSSHLDLVKKFLFFVWEPQRRTVVIGPTLINGSDPRTLELLEKGGTAVRRFFVRDENGNVAEIDKRVNRHRGSKGRFVSADSIRVITSSKAPPRNVVYPARPFMGPANEKELPKLPGMWKDAVRP